MKPDIFDGIMVVGWLVVSCGVGLYDLGAGLIVLGVGMVAAGVLGSMRKAAAGVKTRTEAK